MSVALREVSLGEWRFSFSQLQTYSQCGEKYRLVTLAQERPPRQPAAWLVHGNAYHNAANRWHETGESQSLEALYHEEWAKELELQLEKQPDLNLWVKTPRVNKTEQDLKLRKEAGLQQIRAYVTRFQTEGWTVYADDDGLYSEIDFDVQFGPYKVRGFLDQVRQGPQFLELVDLKTGSEKGTDKRQLGLYRAAIKQAYGLDIKWGRFFYSKLDSVPKSGDKMGRYSAYYDLSAYDEDYWEQEFGMMWKGIQNGVFLPNPGDNCGMCDAINLCRAKPFI